MSATILLIRHAPHGHLGSILTGRMEDIELTAEGREQAQRLGERLRHEPIAAVHCSPSLRAKQTAAALAQTANLPVETHDALAEVDFGEWTGRPFTELASDPAWRVWNDQREAALAPGGEGMLAVQERAWTHVTDTARMCGNATIAMVSHCDVIRALIARALGLSLNNLLRFDIAPASVSRLTIGEWGERVISINERTA